MVVGARFVMHSREQRARRARQSLEGLSCGDAFGDRFFRPREEAVSLVRRRVLPAPPWLFTDDTMMAASIVSTLEMHDEINQDHLALAFANQYDLERDYGPSIHGLLEKIRQGHHWRSEA